MSEDNGANSLSSVFTDAEPYSPDKSSVGQDTASDDSVISSILSESGVAILTEKYSPEELQTALEKFSTTLAQQSPLTIAIGKTALNKKLKEIKVPTSTDLVKALFRSLEEQTSDSQGATLWFEDPDPWEEEVEGQELLNEIESTFKEYLILPEGGSVAVTLYILNSYCTEASFICPILFFKSPEKRCGKTTAMRLCGAMVSCPLLTTSISSAALFRTIEKYGPTILIDEADTFVKDSEEIRGVINAGHTRDGVVIRSVGDKHEPKAFRVYGAKIIAAIGGMPTTIEDRAIAIPMKRRHSGEKVERLRGDRLDQFENIKRKCIKWAETNLDKLKAIDPEVPAFLDDRAADNWRPLFSIASVVGGLWSEKALKAAEILSKCRTEDESDGVLLLKDIHYLFNAQKIGHLLTEVVILHLATLENRPWSEWRRGKPITPRQLASLLKPFNIQSGQVWMNGANKRGYSKVDFLDAWDRYLPLDPLESNNNNQLDPDSDTLEKPISSGLEGHITHCKEKGLVGLADQKPANEDKEKKEDTEMEEFTI
jgi:hypothetical protein